jgi:hypothetical protein
LGDYNSFRARSEAGVVSMLRGGERAIVRVKIPMRKVEEEEEVFN